jgi:hypothetical protein
VFKYVFKFVCAPGASSAWPTRIESPGARRFFDLARLFASAL